MVLGIYTKVFLVLFDQYCNSSIDLRKFTDTKYIHKKMYPKVPEGFEPQQYKSLILTHDSPLSLNFTPYSEEGWVPLLYIIHGHQYIHQTDKMMKMVDLFYIFYLVAQLSITIWDRYIIFFFL